MGDISTDEMRSVPDVADAREWVKELTVNKKTSLDRVSDAAEDWKRVAGVVRYESSLIADCVSLVMVTANEESVKEDGAVSA